jgi:hypothetical protein
MDWKVIQAVECLLCKHETLSSNPNSTKKKKRFLIFQIHAETVPDKT